MMKLEARTTLTDSEAYITVDMTISENLLKIHETQLGTRVSLENCLPSGKLGGPGLPAKTIWVALPPKTQLQGQLQTKLITQTRITHKPTVLTPLRKPRRDFPDKTYSEISTTSPVTEHYLHEKKMQRPLAQLIETNYIGDTPVAMIRINPIFFGREAALELATKVQITLPLERATVKTMGTEDGGVHPVSYSQLSRLADLARAIVINPSDVKTPDFSPKLLAKWDYLIVTDDKQWNPVTQTPSPATAPGVTAAFTALRDWKTNLGFHAKIVTLTEIVQSTAGTGLGANFKTGSRDLQHTLRKFLRWAHDNWGTTYVLLGGDQNIIPIRHLPIGSWDKSLPTDLYYANLNPANDWPEDVALNYSTFDFNRLKPDLSIGRAPVTNKAEADTFVNKVISYEQLGKGTDALTQDWLHKILYASTKWGGDDPTDILPSSSFPPTDNQYYHAPGSTYSLIKLKDTVLITRNPNTSGNPDNNQFIQIAGKSYYKIKLEPTYKLIQDIFVLTQAGKRKLTPTDKASATNPGWYYTDWTNTNDGPCHNAKGENYPTNWIIVYLAPNEIPASFEVQLKKEFRLDYNLLSNAADGDYRPIPYNIRAGSTAHGWYFAKSATDPSASAINTATGLQLPTAWIAAYASAPDLTPPKFVLDPTEEADTMQEQEQLRKSIQTTIPCWDNVSRLYPDVIDLPLPDRTAPEVQYFTKDHLREKLNQGYHIISIAGHGNPSCTCGGEFDLALADQLINGSHCGIMFANSCLTNRYTEDSLSRHLVVKNARGGMVAYVGFLDVISIGLGSFVQKKFFKDLATSGVIGTAFDARVSMLEPGSGFDINSSDVRYTIFMMGLLGDPSLKVHGALPVPLTAKQLIVGQNTNGGLEVIYTRADKKIYHVRQAHANGGWERACALDGWAKQIAVEKNADGRLELIYIGTDDKIYHAWQTSPNGGWTQSYVLDGWAKQVAVAKNADGRLEVIYIGSDDKIYHVWQTSPNSGWTQSYVLDGWAKQLVVASNADGRLEVIYIGTDNKIYHVWQTSPNSGWTQSYVLDGWAKQVAVAKNADGRLEVIYIGSDDKIYHVWQTSPNSGWTQSYVLDGWAKQLVVASNADGRLEVIYIGTDDKIYHVWQTSPNSGWTQSYVLDGWAKQVAFGKNADGRLEVIYIGTDDKIYHVWQTSPNSGWTQSYLLKG